jgi:hypothetical protein
MKRHYPLLIGLAALWLVLILLAVADVRHNDGHLVYTVDDIYIHMAIAKNLATHGVWGVTRHAFTSASSSIAWPILLAGCFRVFGEREEIPFVLNVVFASAAVLAAHVALNRHGVSRPWAAAILVAFSFCSALGPVSLSGLEHMLQVALVILFIDLAAGALGAEGQPARLDERWLLVLAPLLVMARFEGVFIAFVACCLFLARRRTRYAFALGALALAPVVVYGLVSVEHGWFFLPNSVVMKASRPMELTLRGLALFALGVKEHGSAGIRQIIAAPHVQAVVIGAVAAFFVLVGKGCRLWDRRLIALVLVLATTLLHVYFALIASWQRYETYLVALGVLYVPIALHGQLPRLSTLGPAGGRALSYGVGVLGALVLVEPLVERGVKGVIDAPVAAGNIYRQQYQMARFVREFFPGTGVVANDIGAINYFNDISNLDLYGLADMDIARLKKARRLNPLTIAQVASKAGMDVAMVYDTWYAPYGGLPAEWARVGEWTIGENVACGDATVSFYAVRPELKERLSAALSRFSPGLPRDVGWKVY